MRIHIAFILLSFFIQYSTIASADTRKTIFIGKIAVDIVTPETKIKGDILVLPGWGFSKDQWCRHTELCTKALAQGYRLILPEMGKSIYASHYYIESRKDWTIYSTKKWITDTLISELQSKYGVLTTHNANYLLGLSTGARGAVLIGISLPGLFSAVAALSGDYDQTLCTQDNLMTGIYGRYENFPSRWRGEDNPTYSIKSFNMPLYLGHGMKDTVVKPDQTIQFYRLLHKINPKLDIRIHIAEKGAHNFNYWNSEVDSILIFFSSHK